MHEEACRHTLSALHTMLRHAVHRALFGALSTIACLTENDPKTIGFGQLCSNLFRTYFGSRHFGFPGILG